MVGTHDRVVDIIIASAEELNGSLEEPIDAASSVRKRRSTEMRGDSTRWPSSR